MRKNHNFRSDEFEKEYVKYNMKCKGVKVYTQLSLWILYVIHGIEMLENEEVFRREENIITVTIGTEHFFPTLYLNTQKHRFSVWSFGTTSIFTEKRLHFLFYSPILKYDLTLEMRSAQRGVAPCCDVQVIKETVIIVGDSS